MVLDSCFVGTSGVLPANVYWSERLLIIDPTWIHLDVAVEHKGTKI